jgi:hypothetical protein
LLLPLETDTPREEVLGIEVGTFEEAAPDDDWRIEVIVPVEDPETPPLDAEDTGTETEPLEAPGLL